MDHLLSNGYTLVLGEQAWHIEAGDQDAAPIAAQLADAMKLDSTDHTDLLGLSTRDVRVVTRGDAASADGALVCSLRDISGDDALFCHLLDLSLFIARDAQARGCVLLHGALAERAGKGVILAAPGGIGKTTASIRLPPPWVSL
jgi:hypothetical protein